MLTALVTVAMATIVASSASELPDPSNFFVFGPGLDSDRVLPVRYFFVQLRDSAGRSVDDGLRPEPGDSAVRLEVTANDRPVRCSAEALKLNRKGLYLLRYRLRQSVRDARLSIFYHGLPVAQSPYRLAGDVFDDNCNCPKLSLNEWLNYYGCRSNYTTLEADFARFGEIHMPLVMEEAKKRFSNTGAYAFCRYIIKSNQLYRKCFGEHTGFTFMSDPMLLGLLRKMKMPDLDFVLNLGDWPLSQLSRQPHLPIISWCGSESTADIVMPTYELSEATIHMMDRVYNDVFRTIHDSLEFNWADKVEKAFFRGRDSNIRRLELVRKSVKHPDTIDARLTNMFFFDKTEDLGGTVKHVPMNDFFKYKYQVSVDGTVAAYRLPFLLAGGSPVLKQASNYYEHFYADLLPNRHFVPLREDLGDLDERISWLRRNDRQARRIADSAVDFVLENLLPEHILCYQASVMARYSKALASEVTVPDGFEKVDQPSDSNCRCNWGQEKVEL